MDTRSALLVLQGKLWCLKWHFGAYRQRAVQRKPSFLKKAYEPIPLGPASKSPKSVERLQRALLPTRKHNHDLN